MQVISRQEALAAGLKRYFTGKPCKRGHVAERRIKGDCVECDKENNRAWHAANTEKARESDRAWRVANPEKVREWYAANREKVRERVRTYRAANPEKVREYARKRRGASPPTRPRPESCEACGKPPGRSALNEDHCHETGLFRGWLCSNCNAAIGLLGDTLENVMRAVEYLKCNGTEWLRA